MPIQPTGILGDLVRQKQEEVARRRESISMKELEAMVAQADPPRNFFRAVTRHPTAVHFSVIAEIKRKTPIPRNGEAHPGMWIRPEYEHEVGRGNGEGAGRGGFDPAAIARAYHAAGAAAISCVTDEPNFGGRLEWLDRVREATPLPVLRKDVLIEPWQLWESRAHGADAVLLIAETLTEGELLDMLILAQQLQLTVVLEVHDMDNLLRVRPHVGFPHAGYSLLAINNSDPMTLKADLAHTLRLADMVEDRSILVSEAGIESREDVLRLRSVGVRIGLEGDSLLREVEPGAKLEALLKSAFEVP